MNIRVDLTTPIIDGMGVIFRSPVDCSQIAGLIVYYKEESKEFAFADAHGHNVGDIDHLFAENAVVKVILDVTYSMAYVQNADTNAYIERTFVKTVNGVAPDENGNVVVEPAIDEQVIAVVEAYLEEHPVEPVKLDTTLSVAGKAADAKAVGDAIAAVDSTNIYIGDNTNTTVDEDGNVTTVEGSGGSGGSSEPGGSGSGGSASSAEWQHLATVDFADEANQLQKTSFTGLDNITEIFVKSNGVQTADETNSSFYLTINGKQVALSILPLNKSGTTHYAWFYAKYNGLVWLPIKPQSGAIADPNLGYAALQVPYGVVFDVGAATEFGLTVSTPSVLPAVGTLDVYVR